jgi:hypothetical protein
MDGTPTPFPFTVFTFGLTVESIKELAGVLREVTKVSNAKRFWRTF